ncbi:MIT domain protein [Teladorsagia circumcincta]|uniref:MIT domain protein n=1 Tax=Teladorsagia circumcincta TaxID=45464 RepID=A0A2G9V3H6_TELCI|nr:MIT domain protein [Teladorsagia circumcincta]
MELYRVETVKIEETRLLEALACHRNVTVLKSILDMALYNKTLRMQDVSHAFWAVATNRFGHELVFNYFLENWDMIYASAASGVEVDVVLMSKEDKLIESAKKSLIKAVDYDKKEKPNDALRYYMDGIDSLDKAVKLMSLDDNRRSPLYKQIAQYVSRAEQLKEATKVEVGFLEQRRIEANSVGHGYDKIFGRCLDDKLTAVSVQDAYILNFVRFCELVVGNAPNIRCITLRTGMDARNNQPAFDELAHSLEKVNVVLKVEFSPSIHDREIRFNNGWIIKIGRGLDYFKNPGKYVLGASDMNFRQCHETTVDIMRQKK